MREQASTPQGLRDRDGLGHVGGVEARRRATMRIAGGAREGPIERSSRAAVEFASRSIEQQRFGGRESA